MENPKEIAEMTAEEIKKFLYKAISTDSPFILQEIINDGGEHRHDIEHYSYDCYGPSWSHRKELINYTTKIWKLNSEVATLDDLKAAAKRLRNLGWRF